MSGPLTGLRVVEVAAIGPAPFAAMMLADMGAEVLRVDRVPPAGRGAGEADLDLLNRGRRSVAVDLKRPEGVGAVLRLAGEADALLEGFRPGVAERLGIGPEDCRRRNRRLVYGRMTGWGQDGPNAGAPGHDINYIALAGALHHVGRPGGPPVPPLNLVGDFGGGGMVLAFGVVCALLEAGRSGEGQVVDAAMVDGAALLMTMLHALLAQGLWSEERGINLLDGGAHFYDAYECADGGHVAVGAIEPTFYAELRRLAGLDADEFAAQLDRGRWPQLKAKLAEVFRSMIRDELWSLLEGSYDRFAPVLCMFEVSRYPHIRIRR